MEKLNEILRENKFQKNQKLTKFSINLYNNDDHDSLMKLYDKVFPGYMDESLWNWKNYKNPFGKFLTVLMKDEEKIIGAYSVAPKLFYINGMKSKCVQSMDTMTDEKYRGLGISTYLANLTYEYAKRRSFQFVYGFPNEVSRYLFAVKLEWKKVIKSKYFVKRLTRRNLDSILINKNLVFDNSEFKINEIKIFDEKVNELWLRNKMSYPIIIEKNSNYLNWRFVEHPQIKYQKYYIVDDNGKLISYFVLKKYKNANDELVGHIVDFLIDSMHYTLKEKIFQLIENYSVRNFKEDCQIISFWMPDTELQKFITQNLGYKFVENIPYFGYKKFSNVKELLILDSLKNWYITMSNEDVF